MKARSRMMGNRNTPDVDSAIRRAQPPEAGPLSALVLRSKAHWGYDADFLAACRDDLTLTADDIATSTVFVIDGENSPLGFYRLLHRDNGVAELDALFVEPAAMGRGVGKRLWRHAVATAATLGCSEIVLQSDPQAEGFYLAMGAACRRIGVDGHAGADAAADALPTQVEIGSGIVLDHHGFGAGQLAAAPPALTRTGGSHVYQRYMS